MVLERKSSIRPTQTGTNCICVFDSESPFLIGNDQINTLYKVDIVTW